MPAMLMRALVPLLLLVSCSSKRENQPSEPSTAKRSPAEGAATGRPQVVAADKLPEAVAEIARAQGNGFEGGSAQILRAYNAPGTPPVGTKLVGAELRLVLPGGNFDPDDIDIIDADTNENHGSGPRLQRVTEKGEPAAWTDPVFPDHHHIRLIAVWAVPPALKRIKLGYWEQTIAGPTTIEGTGPTVVEVTETPIGYGTAGMLANGDVRHVLLIESFAARAQEAPTYQLVIENKLAHAVQAIEVDEQLHPVTATLEQRPMYAKRWWLLVTHATGQPTEVNQFGKRVPLPARRLTLDKKVLAALQRPPR